MALSASNRIVPGLAIRPGALSELTARSSYQTIFASAVLGVGSRADPRRRATLSKSAQITTRHEDCFLRRN